MYKGKGKGEDGRKVKLAEETALRETREETGLEGKIVGNGEISYNLS